MPFGYRFTMIAYEFALSICACNRLQKRKKKNQVKKNGFSKAHTAHSCGTCKRAYTASKLYLYTDSVYMWCYLRIDHETVRLYCCIAHSHMHIAHHTYPHTHFNFNLQCEFFMQFVKCNHEVPHEVKIDGTLTNSASQQQHKWRKELHRFYAIFAFAQIKRVFNLFSLRFRYAVSRLIELSSIRYHFHLFFEWLPILLNLKLDSDAGKEVISTRRPICFLSSLLSASPLFFNILRLHLLPE